MAGSSLYQDDETPAITDINVTPFVDVALVLLVVFMVVAKLIVARGVEIDKPTAEHGGEVPATLRISVNAEGRVYVNGDTFADDKDAVARIKQLASTMPEPKVLITGDKKTQYGGVMHAIDLALDANITAIALENERP